VVLDYWAVDRVDPGPFFSTLASWSGYEDLCFGGEWYRSKYEEFRRFAKLPTRTNQGLQIVLKTYRDQDSGVEMLKKNGWQIAGGEDIFDLDSYQDFVFGSRAEIGIAKNAYVKSRSGWFSDRSAHYLAAGRPVLAQSTGFEGLLPTGDGLVTFSTVEEAVAGIESINGDYDRHCRAAREFAREHLDFRRVLTRLIEDCEIEAETRTNG
jgi:hypothetical protein